MPGTSRYPYWYCPRRRGSFYQFRGLCGRAASSRRARDRRRILWESLPALILLTCCARHNYFRVGVAAGVGTAAALGNPEEGQRGILKRRVVLVDSGIEDADLDSLAGIRLPPTGFTPRVRSSCVALVSVKCICRIGRTPITPGSRPVPRFDPAG
jgi:hypothetical protein